MTGVTVLNRPLRSLALLLVALLAVSCGEDDAPSMTPDADSGDGVGDDTGPLDAEEDAIDALDVADDPAADPAGDAIDAADGDEDAGIECPDRGVPVEPTARAELSEEDGPNPATPVPEGAARAGRLRDASSELFHGEHAACRPGDIVLSNASIRACVAAENAVAQFFHTGGQLIDLQRTSDGAADGMHSAISATGLLVAAGDTVEIVRDGTDGGPAVVRTSGVELMMQIITNVVGPILPIQSLRFTTEYRLAPDAEYLEVVTWVGLDGRTRGPVAAGDLVILPDRASAWWPGSGFASPSQPDIELLGVIGRDASWGVWAPAMRRIPLNVPSLDLPLSGTELFAGAICDDATAAIQRYFAPGLGDIESVLDAFATLRPRDGETASFRAPTTAGWERPRFEIRDEEGRSVTIVRLDPDGTASARLAAGEYAATPLDWPAADPPATAFTVPHGDGEVALPGPTLGWLELRVRDATGVPIPARVAGGGAQPFLRHVPPGDETIALLPGEYALEISRGPEFSVVVEAVTIAEGETTQLERTLERILDTTGWASGDMHQHTSPSFDSEVAIYERVLTNLAAGVDFIAPSDHDIVVDFRPTVEAIGAGDLLHVYHGVEISPVYGHFNAFPVMPNVTAPRNGTPPVSEREGTTRTTRQLGWAEMINTAREFGAEVIQFNHPRDSQGYFNYAEYDPIAGPEAAAPDKWHGEFESLEVLNGDSEFCEVLRDWFGLLSRGFRVTGVGNSDTHSAGRAAGWPRNYLAIDDDDPASLTDRAITDAVLGMHVTVSAGILIDFPDGPLPGETIIAPESGPVSLPVRVRSTPWAAVDELVIYVNGREFGREPVDSALEAIDDFEGPIELDLDEDAYVVFVAWSATTTRQVTPGKSPIAFTNPIYVDVGDDGWDPPGVDSDEDLPVITGYSFCR